MALLFYHLQQQWQVFACVLWWKLSWVFIAFNLWHGKHRIFDQHWSVSKVWHSWRKKRGYQLLHCIGCAFNFPISIFQFSLLAYLKCNALSTAVWSQSSSIQACGFPYVCFFVIHKTGVPLNWTLWCHSFLLDRPQTEGLSPFSRISRPQQDWQLEGALLLINWDTAQIVLRVLITAHQGESLAHIKSP